MTRRPLATPLGPLRAAAAVALLLCYATVGDGVAWAQDERQPAILDLVVNEVGKGEALVLLAGTDALVGVADLERCGVRVEPGRRETVDGRELVSLASLAPGIRFVVDQRALTLRITAAARLLSAMAVVDLAHAARPVYERSRTTSGFVNYGVGWRRSGGYEATGEAGASWAGALATTTFSWNRARSAVRGMSSVTLDSPERLRRVVLGDSVAGDRVFGGSLFLAGARVASEYSTDPYFLRYPTLGLSGAVTTPSSVEVYVDDRLVRREQIEPGQFRIDNLQVPVGSSQTRLVIRDAFGREQQISTPYYLATTVLAPGLHEYEYAVGFPRRDVAAASWSYGRLTALAHHRYGFSRSVTAGLRAEASADLVNAGPTINARIPFGEIEAAFALSRAVGRTGTAASLGYSHMSRLFSVGFTGRAWSRMYRAATSDLVLDPPRREVNAYAAAQLGPRLTLTVQQAAAESQRGAVQSRSSLLGTARLTGRANAFFVLARAAVHGRATVEATIGMSFSLRDRTSGSVAFAHHQGESSVASEVQRSMPVGTGFGYRLRAGDAGGSGGRLEYQSAFGRYALDAESLGGRAATSVSAAGGIVAIGGKLFAARPVDEAYALVRVPGVSGVRGFLSNQEVGRTGRSGDLLVPNLLPYYANRLRVSDEDIPLERAVGETERAVAPAYRGGALVVFGAAILGAASGRVHLDLDGVLVVPAFGDLVVHAAGRRTESPIGRDGSFYLENLVPGAYRAEVRYHGASCSFTLSVPPSSEAVVDLGLSTCIQGGAR